MNPLFLSYMELPNILFPDLTNVHVTFSNDSMRISFSDSNIILYGDMHLFTGKGTIRIDTSDIICMDYDKSKENIKFDKKTNSICDIHMLKLEKNSVLMYAKAYNPHKIILNIAAELINFFDEDNNLRISITLSAAA